MSICFKLVTASSVVFRHKREDFLFVLGFGWRVCFLFSKIPSERVLEV